MINPPNQSDSYSQIDQTEQLQSRIKKLSPLLINQLSAGEVVTRPASVVKELLENAIDANASNVQIHITNGGMGLIEISDDGCGIHPDDMPMAVTRHATSKVADVGNLQGIRTLGFRGEALASIVAVARLTLTSSHDDSGVGRCLTVTGVIGDTPNIVPCVSSRGTRVSVKDLYFNVPARRGNLKSVATEYGHIETLVRHIALIHSNINLYLYHDGKCRLKLVNQSQQQTSDAAQSAVLTSGFDQTSTSSLNLQRLQQALNVQLPPAYPLNIDLTGLMPSSIQMDNTDNVDSVDNVDSMVEPISMNQSRANSVNDACHITGWLWLKQANSFTEDGIALPKLIYINGRLVKDAGIAGQIRQTFASLSLSLQQVGYALAFTLPTNWCNLNVHPSKQRIGIHALSNINAHLHQGIKQLVTTHFITTESSHIQPTHQANAQSSTQLNPSIQSIQNSNRVNNHTNKDNQQLGDYLYPSKQALHTHKVAMPKQKVSYQIDSHVIDKDRLDSLAKSINTPDAIQPLITQPSDFSDKLLSWCVKWFNAMQKNTEQNTVIMQMLLHSMTANNHTNHVWLNLYDDILAKMGNISELVDVDAMSDLLELVDAKIENKPNASIAALTEVFVMCTPLPNQPLSNAKKAHLLLCLHVKTANIAHIYL